MTHNPKAPFRRERRAGRVLVAGVLTLGFALLVPGIAGAHGDLHDQIAAVTKEIALHPADAGLYVKRGELHRFHGDVSEALADYDRAALLNPSLAEADLGRGRALLATNRVNAAHQALSRFVHRRPDHAEGRLSLARALVKLQRHGEAAAEYSRAIALFSTAGPDVYVERSRALAAANRVAEAVAGLDEGIRKLGELVSLHDVAIDLELRRKNWDGAIARGDRVARSLSRRETWLARRGEILVAAGRPREARKSFEAAQQSIEALAPRFRQRRAMSRLEEKVRDSLAALKENPDAKS